MILGLLLVLGVLSPQWAQAITVATMTLDFNQATVTPTQARIGVLLDYPVGAADTLEAFQIQLAGTSDPLVTPGGDFSRFSFEVDNTSLPDWEVAIDFPAGSGGAVVDPGLFGAPLVGPQANLRLGEIVIDLAGLPDNYLFIVTINNGVIDGLQTDLVGTVGGNFVLFRDVPTDDVDLQFGTDTVTIVTPQGTANVIPEPATAASAAVAALGLLLATRRRRA
jgi:hypothetical protein